MIEHILVSILFNLTRITALQSWENLHVISGVFVTARGNLDPRAFAVRR